jgi:DNA-directed RNA polymerase subunit RPC12/RpoP
MTSQDALVGRVLREVANTLGRRDAFPTRAEIFRELHARAASLSPEREAGGETIPEAPPSPVTEAGKGELLPCPLPLCGGQAEFESTIMDAAIRCTSCGLKLIHKHQARDSTAGATVRAAWNRRPSPPSAGVEVVKEARAGFQLVPCLEGRAAWPPEMNDAAAAFYDAHSAAIWRHGSYESFYAGWNAALKVLKALEPK